MRLENYIVRELPSLPKDGLTGRTKIKTTAKAITAENVREVLEESLAYHSKNAREIQYLWDCYRGKQDIRKKKKYVRENINNKITVNRANQVVTFKTAYLLNEPIQYISHGGNDKISANVVKLNEFMRQKISLPKTKRLWTGSTFAVLLQG